VVKVIWHNLTASPPQTDGSIIFARWHQCALPYGHIGATWLMQLNLCFLRPTWVYNQNGKSIGSAVSAQLTAECPYTLQWATLSPKIAPSHGGSRSPSNSWFLGPVWAHKPNGIKIGSAILAQVTTECPYTLKWAAFPLKIAPSHGGSWPQSNTWFPGPTWVFNLHCISIGSTIFVGLTNVTDRVTGHAARSVTIDCIYVHSTGDAA